MEPGTVKREQGTRNGEPGTWNMEHGTGNREPGTGNNGTYPAPAGKSILKRYHNNNPRPCGITALVGEVLNVDAAGGGVEFAVEDIYAFTGDAGGEGVVVFAVAVAEECCLLAPYTVVFNDTAAHVGFFPEGDGELRIAVHLGHEAVVYGVFQVGLYDHGGYVYH